MRFCSGNTSKQHHAIRILDCYRIARPSYSWVSPKYYRTLATEFPLLWLQNDTYFCELSLVLPAKSGLLGSRSGSIARASANRSRDRCPSFPCLFSSLDAGAGFEPATFGDFVAEDRVDKPVEDFLAFTRQLSRSASVGFPASTFFSTSSAVSSPNDRGHSGQRHPTGVTVRRLLARLHHHPSSSDSRRAKSFLLRLRARE